MAKLMVIGMVAQVEILTDPTDEELVLAACVLHPKTHKQTGRICTWRDTYDTTDDAFAGAEQHADGVR